MDIDETLRRASRKISASLAKEQIPQFPVRSRRRWRILALAAVVTLVVVGGPAVILRISSAPVGVDETPPGVVQATTTTSENTTSPAGLATKLDLEFPVALELLAVRSAQLSALALLDLDSGEVTMFTKASLGLTQDPIDGAALTPDGTILAWQGGLVVAIQPTMEEPLIVHQVEGLVHLPEAAPAVSAAPTLDGRRLWVVQQGSGIHDLAGRADLIELDTGEVQGSTALPPNTSWVAATSRGLLLNTHTLVDTGDGYLPDEGSQRVLELTFDGELTELAAGEALAASGLWAAVMTCDQYEPPVECDLVLVHTETRERRSVPQPVDGRWSRGTAPSFPTEPPHRNATSPEGHILLSIWAPNPDDTPGAAESYLLSVHPDRPDAVEVLHRVEGFMPRAVWDRTGDKVVLIGDPDGFPVRKVTVLNLRDGTSRTMPDLIPSEYTVINAH